MRSKQLQKLLDRGERGNPLDRIAKLERRNGEIKDLRVEQISDLSDDLGSIARGEFIAPASTAESLEPTSEDFTGSFMAGDGYNFGDTLYHVGVVLQGVLQAGMSATGKFLAAAGNYILDAAGVTITGIDFLMNHTAEYDSAVRRARQGFQVVGGELSYVIEFIDDAAGTNLITSNPGFETGDFTGWTTGGSGGSWSASNTAPYEGNYNARWASTAVGSATLTSAKYAVSAGASYNFRKAIRISNNRAFGDPTYYAKITVTLKAKWYNAVPTLLKTDTIYSDSFEGGTGGWSLKSASFTAPSGATQVEFVAEITVAVSSKTGTYYGTWYTEFDSASIEALSEYAYFRLADDGVFAGDETKEVALLGSAARQVLVGHLSAVVPGSTTTYGGPGSSATNTTETRNEYRPKRAGKVKRLTVFTHTSQPAGNSQVVTMRKSQADQSMACTVSAGAAAGTEITNITEFSFVDTDELSFKIVNNATSNGALLSVFVEIEWS